MLDSLSQCVQVSTIDIMSGTQYLLGEDARSKETCVGPPGEGECSYCCGNADLTMMEVMLLEETKVTRGFNGFPSIETLKKVEDFAISILRETLLGRRKFASGDWKRLMDIITEIRACEVVSGLKTVLMKEIAGKDIELEANELQQLVRMMVQYSIDEHTRALVKERVAVYNIRTGNRIEFVKGRCEMKEIERTNTMVVALSGYFCVAKGIPTGSHFETVEMGGRCTKITGIHVLAANGKASLPGGLPGKKDEAILPMPLEANKPNVPKKEFEKLMPIAVYRSDRL